MKKLIALLVLLFSFSGNAQILDPVKWTTKIVQKSNTEFELVMDAVIEPSWHMYSQFTPDGGALPMIFEYKNAKGNYELIYNTKKYGIPCERRFEINYENIVVGFVSNGCF